MKKRTSIIIKCTLICFVLLLVSCSGEEILPPQEIEGIVVGEPVLYCYNRRFYNFDTLKIPIKLLNGKLIERRYTVFIQGSSVSTVLNYLLNHIQIGDKIIILNRPLYEKYRIDYDYYVYLRKYDGIYPKIKEESEK